MQSLPACCLVLSLALAVPSFAAFDAYIYVGAKQSPAARLAATELQGYLQQITGARIALIAEGQQTPGSGLAILVGDSDRAKALGFDSTSLEPEQIRIKSGDGWLVVIGNDTGPTGYELQGTLWAACELLERLGVRWLWPGTVGTVVPSKPDLAIPELDIDYTPPIIQRKIRNIQYNDRVQQGLDKLGFTREQFNEVHKDGELWFRAQRIGTQGKFDYGHAFGEWWDQYHEEHPDWFAQQPDGTRDQENIGTRSRICVSNPEVIAKAAQEAIAKLEADPTLYCASISPNDGGRATFCLCERCRALDPPEAEMVKVWHPTDPEFMIPSLTDRYVRFYTEVAKIVAERLPDRYLGAYAYSAYRLPPVREKLHPNVFIGFVGFSYMNEESRQSDRETWDAWTKGAERFFLRPNLLQGGMGYPSLFPHRLVEDLKHCFETGMRVTDFDCCYQHWGLKGLNYYVLARFLWNPAIDVDEVIDDYCQAGWGPAADPVRKYFDRLEQITDTVARDGEFGGRKDDARILASYYTDEALAELQGYLDEATKLAGEDEDTLARIAFLQTALTYTRLNSARRTAYGELRAGTGGQEKYEDANKALEDYYKSMGINWSVNSPYLKFYGF